MSKRQLKKGQIFAKKKFLDNFQLLWQVTLLGSGNLTPVTRAVMRVML